jgi:hypothetical protein
MRRAAVVTAIMLTLLLGNRPVLADSALVVLVRPSAQSTVVSEAITRIRGELIADGFEVSIVDAPPGSDPASVLARADPQTSAAATLGLFPQPDASAAELWVVDRLTNKTVVRRVELDRSSTGSAPEVLARRSVELLRASMLEILVDARRRPLSPSPRAQASRWAAQALEPQRPFWGVEAGALVLGGFGGIGPAIMPVLRGRVIVSDRFAARLTLSGLGTRPHVQAAEGTATVSQALGLVEGIVELAPHSWLRPAVSLGAGAYHIGAEGSAAWPYEALDPGTWTFAADVGTGLSLSLSSSFALCLEGHATFVTPRPVIRFVGVEIAGIQNPLVGGVLTMMGRL